MDFQFDTMTENGLASLAKAGCVLDVTIFGYGEAARFRAKISKGAAQHDCPGFCLVVEGEGDDGAAALRGAVATAETFLSLVPPRPKPMLPELAPSPSPKPAPAADAMAPRDPLRTAERSAYIGSDLHQRDEADREREPAL